MSKAGEALDLGRRPAWPMTMNYQQEQNVLRYHCTDEDACALSDDTIRTHYGGRESFRRPGVIGGLNSSFPTWSHGGVDSELGALGMALTFFE